MKILIVDDKIECLNPLKEFLEKKKDIDGNPYEEIKGLTNHDKALDLLKKERFDIVVIDMFIDKEMSPEGLNICQQLMLRSSVAIVLTAFASIPNCVRAMRAGAWDYLEKNPDEGDAYDNLLRSIKEGCEFRKEQKDMGMPDPNASWVGKNLGNLMEKHGGKYIAVYDQEVIAEALTLSELRKRLEDKNLLMQPYIINIPDPNTKEI